MIRAGLVVLRTIKPRYMHAQQQVEYLHQHRPTALHEQSRKPQKQGAFEPCGKIGRHTLGKTEQPGRKPFEQNQSKGRKVTQPSQSS